MPQTAEQPHPDFGAMGRKRGWVDGTIAAAVDGAAHVDNDPDSAVSLISHVCLIKKEDAAKIWSYAVELGEMPGVDTIAPDTPRPAARDMTAEVRRQYLDNYFHAFETAYFEAAQTAFRYYCDRTLDREDHAPRELDTLLHTVRYALENKRMTLEECADDIREVFSLSADEWDMAYREYTKWSERRKQAEKERRKQRRGSGGR